MKVLYKVTQICFVFALTMCLVSCVNTRSTLARWLTPANLGTSQPVKKQEKAEQVQAKLEQEEQAKKDALSRQGQKAALGVNEALASAGESRAVNVAKDLNNQALDALAQALGGLPVDVAEQIRQTVKDVLSEDLATKQKGEQELKNLRLETNQKGQELATIRTKLEEQNKKVEELTAALAVAFKKENETADLYRTEKFFSMLLKVGLVVAVLGVAFLWLKYGALLKAAGGAMGVLRSKFPASAVQEVAHEMDAPITPWEQAKIFKYAAISAAKKTTS